MILRVVQMPVSGGGEMGGAVGRVFRFLQEFRGAFLLGCAGPSWAELERVREEEARRCAQFPRPQKARVFALNVCACYARWRFPVTRLPPAQPLLKRGGMARNSNGGLLKMPQPRPTWFPLCSLDKGWCIHFSNVINRIVTGNSNGIASGSGWGNAVRWIENNNNCSFACWTFGCPNVEPLAFLVKDWVGGMSSASQNG